MANHTLSLANVPFDTGGKLTIVEWTVEATVQRIQQAPLHRHHDEDEIWYVLEGALGLRFDDDEFIVPAGGCAVARAGVAHTYWNAADRETRYLLVMQRQTAALVGAIHDPEQRAAMTLAALFRHYDADLLDEV
jgi:mannose-6-phosphate isomerase-like protein (cupin superfamily)